MEDLLDFLKKYRAGFITNLCVPLCVFILVEKEANVLAFIGIFTFLGLMAFDIVCGIAAMFMRPKTKEEDPPDSYNFFLGFFLTGLLLLPPLFIVIFGALDAFM